MSPLLKNGFTLIGIIIIGVLGYYLFVLQKEENTTLSSNTEIGEARLASEQFLRELNAIQTIQLSDEVFTDQRFRSFVEFTKPLPPQPIGRNNPFAPVE